MVVDLKKQTRPLETNATGECFTYHTENKKQTNMHDNRSISSPDVRSFYCQPSSVARYHGSDVCHRNTLPKIILQGTVDGRRRRGRPSKSWKDNIKEWTGQSMSTLQHITDDRGRWEVITADSSVGVPQRRLGVTGIS